MIKNNNNFIFSWSVSASYFTFNNYAFTDYLEYPLLLMQQLTLVSMYLKSNKTSSNFGISTLVIGYLAILYQATKGPAWLLITLIVRILKNNLVKVTKSFVSTKIIVLHTKLISRFFSQYFRILILQLVLLVSYAKFTKLSKLEEVTMLVRYHSPSMPLLQLPGL